MPLDSTSPDTEREFSARAQRDLVLIEAALAGSAKAYEGLLANYRKSLYHVVLRMVNNADDADDLTQEVFAKAFQSLARYRADYAFSTWLFRIATNHCIDFIRKRRLKTLSLSTEMQLGNGDGMLLEVASPELNPQEVYIRQQRIERVQQLVGHLPPKYQKLVRLRYFDELTYEEVAVELQAPLGTVKAQLHKARELLLNLAQKNQGAL
ncbi:sigma-70 family RNA polymerase sigma factor [Hymenobacter sp. DH14]|uniref:RNA polymerase sigma factor n=1 Tax=Hymenobacter cyanobacteriorum TaxID=2926463 RepID=A0A9X1VJ61_9BACT|nr:sigma-70 family RNA polymerase sigma factor [Hymenobacter cyanobacteriorum]MCI1189811.1 sigma-70 family RNA polymerase sigma factor [Hymenobacter cyanobacteriorum]